MKRLIVILAACFFVLPSAQAKNIGYCTLGCEDTSVTFPLIKISSGPVMFVAGSNVVTTLASGATFQTFTPHSAVRLIGITVTVITAGVGGSGDVIRCNNSAGTGLAVTSAAAAAAGTATAATGSVELAASAAISCHMNTTATSRPVVQIALEYQLQ